MGKVLAFVGGAVVGFFGVVLLKTNSVTEIKRSNADLAGRLQYLIGMRQVRELQRQNQDPNIKYTVG